MSPAERARLRAGREAVEDLRRYRTTFSLDRYLTERDAQRQVLHAMLIAVQACIDEALALCRRQGLQTDTYRGAFESLGRTGAIPAEWVPGLLGWASFRNVLAHFYPVVDLVKTYEALAEVEDLDRFLAWRQRDSEA